MSRARPWAVVFSLLCAPGLAALGGCDNQKDRPAATLRKPLPDYTETAKRYNTDIAALDTLWCRATTQMRYTDEHGEKRIEQGEGHLQVQRPDKVALSIGKVGQMLFWMGCDSERYWWMDLTGDTHIASVGRHDGPARAAAASAAAGKGEGGPGGMVGSVSPRAVARVLGIVPLPEKGGTVDWSPDGTQLILTAPVEGEAGIGGTRQRVWIDPEKNIAVRVQLLGAPPAAGKAATPELIAELSEEQFVELIGKAGPKPGVAGKVFVTHPASGTEIRLFLDGLESGGTRIKPAAFNFEQLCKALRVDKVIDLDEQQRTRDKVRPPAPAPGATKAPGTPPKAVTP